MRLVFDIVGGDLAADDRDETEGKAGRFHRCLDSTVRRLAGLLVVRAVADDALEAGGFDGADGSSGAAASRNHCPAC